MRTPITYDQISPLVQYVEVASDMVQCHFHCPVKSKKIVAITRMSKFTKDVVPKTSGIVNSFKCSAIFRLKKYFVRNVEPSPVKEEAFQKEKAVLHAFGKISERFIYSDEHKHFVYRF